MLNQYKKVLSFFALMYMDMFLIFRNFIFEILNRTVSKVQNIIEMMSVNKSTF